MDYKRRIDRIIARARRVRLPIGDLALAAAVSKSTFYRWRQPTANPRVRTMNRALDAMEHRLAEEEQTILTRLQGDAA